MAEDSGLSLSLSSLALSQCDAPFFFFSLVDDFRFSLSLFMHLIYVFFLYYYILVFFFTSKVFKGQRYWHGHWKEEQWPKLWKRQDWLFLLLVLFSLFSPNLKIGYLVDNDNLSYGPIVKLWFRLKRDGRPHLFSLFCALFLFYFLSMYVCVCGCGWVCGKVSESCMSVSKKVDGVGMCGYEWE